MWKAATSQVLVLAAFREQKQIAWADTPVPYATFDEMLTAASGDLGQIIALDNPTPRSASQAQHEYDEHIKQAAAEREARDGAIWSK
eukprot:3935595-Rhodomonas_salina.1